MLKYLPLVLALLTPPLFSAEPLSGVELHRAVNAIAADLRCPSSVNLNVLESEAPIAYELKGQIAEQLNQGKSRRQIIDFLVQRYGEQIHYQPALNAGTAMLWLLPLLLVTTILLILMWPLLRRRHTQH
ncbi:cytochrome c-type biogenesis protein CcmH [Ferrimonas sediminum]|uniref:Cytochrome c-type biogenesis protein n=1 Tax=Ferrimonas sediminum TaxID=718193 RepID=A0A1G8Z6Q4_9GAMM|nr:cytochrome c-type biogenesis protein CcmH [Ferrimonas sediminum]SDK10334.1 cytochrome c-type biogenesis protein CcmH [Ferrimonas sediminum]